VAELKRAVQAFLADHPGSSRRQIAGAVDLPTAAVYNRVMRELRAEGKVVKSGERGQAVYSPAGAARGDT
jgi:hypothetical protein